MSMVYYWKALKLRLKSKPQQLFTSGSSGAFGISLSQLKDSLSLQLDGYEKLCVLADSRQFQRIQLNTLPGTLKLYKK